MGILWMKKVMFSIPIGEWKLWRRKGESGILREGAFWAGKALDEEGQAVHSHYLG